jgi:hypothetical protein
VRGVPADEVGAEGIGEGEAVRDEGGAGGADAGAGVREAGAGGEAVGEGGGQGGALLVAKGGPLWIVEEPVHAAGSVVRGQERELPGRGGVRCEHRVEGHGGAGDDGAGRQIDDDGPTGRRGEEGTGERPARRGGEDVREEAGEGRHRASMPLGGPRGKRLVHVRRIRLRAGCDTRSKK